MEKDFSVAGREKFLAKTYYDPPSIDWNWEFTFARWTLLQRVIWQFITEDTYCHLDGYDLDELDCFTDGFVGVGKVRHLPEPGVPGDIPTIIAVEFNPASFKLQRASIWVARETSNKDQAQKLEIPDLAEIAVWKQNIGSDWQRAFSRDAEGWCLDCDFDLSIFLMPQKNEGDQ